MTMLIFIDAEREQMGADRFCICSAISQKVNTLHINMLQSKETGGADGADEKQIY
jgi:hypothetical protein